MTDAVTLSLAEAESLACAALVASGTTPANAASTARALVHAEADGQSGHGLSRVPSYAAQARVGKVDGRAHPTLQRIAPSVLRVDGALGFAYPAIDLAIEGLRQLVPQHAVAVAVIHRSHHFGQAGAHAERLAHDGMLALAFANSPRAMAFWGGIRAMLGTNPIAFACPLPEREPLVIDLALATVARSKIVAAQKAGKTIPEGWALDSEGRPTTDPTAALQGSLMPIGGAKGAALALIVEILAAALTGSQFGWEASSFLDDKGAAPNVGQVLLAVDPNALSAGAFTSRMQALLQAVAADRQVRLPGERRLSNRSRAQEHGVTVSAALHEEMRQLAATTGQGEA